MAYDKALAKYRAAVGLELRLRGMTYAEIAETVGFYDKSGARKSIRRLIDQRASMAFEAYRVQRFLDLEDKQRQSWVQALNGNHEAFTACLKAADERVALSGLG
jgi:hypothetical protein